jgi:hypothetical protein
MRRLLLALLFVTAHGVAYAQSRITPQDGLSVRADPRIELLAIVFQLAGAEEYGRSRVPMYAQAIDRHFADFREHKAVQEARRLRQARGIGFDAVMSLAIHLDDATTPAPRRVFTESDPSLERRWTPASANRFIELLAEFARDAHFAAFLDSTAASMDTARAQMQRVVNENIDVDALQRFFGRRPSGAFIMVPLITSGNGNYGPRYLEGGREEVYAIIGTSAGQDGWPRFDARFVPTMVHEFSHSFVNPYVDATDIFAKSGNTLYPKVETTMRAQAYGNWRTTVNESLVRASVARYVLHKQGETAARQEVARQRARGFVWTNELYELLGEYERERTTYPTFDAFLPRVAAYFDGLVLRIDSILADIERTRPRIVSMEPADGTKNLAAAAVTKLTVRFDQPMGAGVNLNVGAGGRDQFPEVSNPQWNETKTVLTLDVKLRPQWNYELLLGSGFVSANTTTPLKETRWRFSTK